MVSVSDLHLGGRGEISRELFNLSVKKFIIERPDPSGGSDDSVNRFGIRPSPRMQYQLTAKGLEQKNLLLTITK